MINVPRLYKMLTLGETGWRLEEISILKIVPKEKVNLEKPIGGRKKSCMYACVYIKRTGLEQ